MLLTSIKIGLNCVPKTLSSSGHHNEEIVALEPMVNRHKQMVRLDAR